MKKKRRQPDFDVALSFAGEDRAYVEEVAAALKKMGLRVFYDKYEIVSLWGKDLYTHLREIYFERARYTVAFISKNYKKKLWANHERESAQARAFQENEEYILPARFDKTNIPGILPTIGYINLNDYSPEEFAVLIKEKVGRTERPEFFPDEPDRIYDWLGIPKRATRKRVIVSLIAESFFDSLKLMTIDERRVLAIAAQYTCPEGPPDNIHLRLDYLGRLTSLSPGELRALFARLDCLKIKSLFHKSFDHDDGKGSGKSSEIITITFEPDMVSYIGNGTYVMLAVFGCISDHLCPACALNAIEILDFSVLSTLAGFEEIHTQTAK